MITKRNYFSALLIAVFLVGLIGINNLSPFAKAYSPTEPHEANAMWVEPSIIELNASETPLGLKFNVTLWANSSLECKGWQFWMYYPNTYVNATRAGYTAGTKSEFLQSLTTIGISPSFSVDFNATHNRLDYGEAWLMGDLRQPGYGSLCWVEFEVVNIPPENYEVNIPIDINQAYELNDPPQTYILYSDNSKRPLNVFNGLVRFVAEEPPPPPPEGTRIFVDPPEIIDPTLLPSSTFSVNITIDDVADLQVVWFNMSYDTDIIGWIGLKLFRVENRTPTANAILNDDNGFIWVNLTYPTPFTTLEPTPIVKLDFHVEALGATPLDLHDTGMLDAESGLIDHVAEDGFFLTLIRDLAVINVTADRAWAYQSWFVNINVTVQNKGNISETFTVEAFYGSNNLGNITIENLTPGNQTTISIQWDTQNVTACTNYTISAKIPPIPYEFTVSDNEYVDGEVAIRLLGDVNGNGFVGIDDIVLASEAFGTTPGHPRWNVYADLNQDDYVGIDDIVKIADNFGSEC